MGLRMGTNLDNSDSILKEYELCQKATQSLESTIWQTSSLFGGLSVGTLLLVAQLDPPIGVAIPISILVILLGFIWWSLAKRWWSVQHTKFTRMLQIELAQKRPGQCVYVQYLNDLARVYTRSRPEHSELMKNKEVGKIQKKYGLKIIELEYLHKLNWENFYKPGPREILPVLPYLNLVAWIIYIAFVVLSPGLLEPFSFWKWIILIFIKII
jgi:hypothetical protein